jgi:uncharacterized membrane protein
MPHEIIDAGTGDASESQINITHAIYALHTLSLVIGLTTAVSIVMAFIFGLPSIIAVIINYLKRGAVRGTFLESHFRWQIRTFWYGVVWYLTAWILIFTLIGIPLAIAVFVGLGIWFFYRVTRGWLRLNDKIPMYA